MKLGPLKSPMILNELTVAQAGRGASLIFRRCLPFYGSYRKNGLYKIEVDEISYKNGSVRVLHNIILPVIEHYYTWCPQITVFLSLWFY